MSRRIQIYVSSEVFGQCLLVAKSKSDEWHKFTVEDVIEDFAKSAIKEKYPKIIEHDKAVDKQEKELLKLLCKSQP